MLLATPFAFDYDLALLAVPLACLGWEVYQTGPRPGEELLLALAYLLPFLAPLAAHYLRLPLAPLALAAMLAAVVRRARAPRGAAVGPEESCP
jgi:hypothetical protein